MIFACPMKLQNLKLIQAFQEYSIFICKGTSSIDLEYLMLMTGIENAKLILYEGTCHKKS